ncbi:arrestin domain-containing protein 2-like isoform X2 [Athalia rosae]|uniref:arrestin domain-containing protein 2-like isoform X2 n=1 Tax=Athalia rosae TaxID=37344 RepID=UPI0020336B51|nr:arrestin domain-containing protein 2-like isoform X2 [Athalia rosae]
MAECGSENECQDAEEWRGTSELKIVLDHPQGVFYPGNRVTGAVLLNINGPRPVLALRLKCEGEGMVFFTDRSAGFRRKFSNTQSYLSVERYLFDGKSEGTIPNGENVFPFSVDLPDEIPCSFEGRYGRVRYSVAAYLERGKVARMTTSVSFTVAPVLDLNQDSLATLPISEDNSKAIVGYSEPLNMLVTLPVRGFVPGQTIPVKIVLKNPSKIEIRKIRVVFKKVITYHADRKSRRHKEIVVEIEIPVIANVDLYETGVDVPAVPPTGMVFCGIIDVWYTLKVEACIEVDEWYLKILKKNLKTRMRIVIGTVPLRHYETPEEEERTFAESDEAHRREFDDKKSVTESTPAKMRSKSNDNKFYKESKIYPSSKPNRDDPTGTDDDGGNGDADSYAPLYQVYKFNKNKDKTSTATDSNIRHH